MIVLIFLIAIYISLRLESALKRIDALEQVAIDHAVKLGAEVIDGGDSE